MVQPLPTDNKDVVLLLCSVTNHHVSMLPCWFQDVCVCVCVLINRSDQVSAAAPGVESEREERENLICSVFILFIFMYI